MICSGFCTCTAHPCDIEWNQVLVSVSVLVVGYRYWYRFCQRYEYGYWYGYGYSSYGTAAILGGAGVAEPHPRRWYGIAAEGETQQLSSKQKAQGSAARIRKEQ